MPLRVVFMGTPDFAVPTLLAVLDAGHDVAAVYTQPARPAGRGMAARPSPVQLAAERANIPVMTPASLKRPEAQARFAALKVDVGVVVAYGLILPELILTAVTHGCLNVHASLLPRWRGAAPIQRAIMAGDGETGVCIMRMDRGLDTGPICLLERTPIAPDATAGDLHHALARAGADLMVRALAALSRHSLDCRPQGQEGATYAAKIDKAETRIDWTRPAVQVHNLIRGLSPWPGAWFDFPAGNRRERVKVLRSELTTGKGRPGEIIAPPFTVACGEGAVRLVQVQRAGKTPMRGEDAARGLALAPGVHLP